MSAPCRPAIRKAITAWRANRCSTRRRFLSIRYTACWPSDLIVKPPPMNMRGCCLTGWISLFSGLATPVIAAAVHKIVLVGGSGKAGAVAQALEGPENPDACPAQLARDGIWIMDRAAASGLRHKPPR